MTRFNYKDRMIAKFVHDRYCKRCCAGDDVARCLKCIYNANNLFLSLPNECFWNLFVPDEGDKND
jgi:hypothetical protein